MRKIFIYGFFLLGLLSTLFACSEVTIKKIEIVSYGKTEYILGETFSSSGYEIKVTFTDDTSIEVEVLPDMINADLSAIGQTECSIEYTYKNKIYTKEFMVEVKTTTIEGLAFSQTGKTTYTVGTNFDVTGFVVLVAYADLPAKEINLTLDMCTVDLSKIGDTFVKVTYTDPHGTFSFEYPITVTDIVYPPTKIEVKQTGKEFYCNKVALDLSEYIFTVTYEDGTTKDVVLTNDNADITTFEKLENESVDVEITISYTENDVTVTTTITVVNMDRYDYDDYYGPIEETILKEKIYADALKLIPSEVTSETTKINLFQSSTYSYQFIIVWSSSHPSFFSSTGNLKFNEDDLVVELTLQLRGSYITETFTFQILMKGIGPAKLKELDKSKKLVFAYDYDSNWISLTEQNAKKIDVINYCFGRVSADGTLTINNLIRLDEVLSYRRTFGVRVVLSIGGGGMSENFGAATVSEKARAKLVSQCMEVLKVYKFDGIDIDWEFPNGMAEVNALSSFIKELKAEMDAYRDDLLFTAAVIAGGNVNDIVSKFDIKVMNEYLDYVHIMTYDLNSAYYATHHSNPYAGSRPYSAQNSINIYHAAGLDYNKIVIGAAFYGKISTLDTAMVVPGADVLMKRVGETTTLKYSTIISDYFNKNGYQYFWDDSCKAPYLTDGYRFITYENAESIYWKAKLIHELDLGGMMFWDYGSDSTGQLLTAVSSNINLINLGIFI